MYIQCGFVCEVVVCPTYELRVQTQLICHHCFDSLMALGKLLIANDQGNE